MSSYKSTSLDRKRKHLPYLPDDVFHLIMHYRNRLMRRDEVRELRKEMQSNKIEINNLKDEISELWESGDEDEEEQLEAEENQLEEFIEGADPRWAGSIRGKWVDPGRPVWTDWAGWTASRRFGPVQPV